jgi:hypothetical protein
LSKCPANGVALGFVVETIALVLVFGAAGAWVNAVLGLEVLGKFVNVDRLHVAANRVLHLDPVTGVLESDPLNAVLVLSNNQWGGGRNGARCGVGVNVWSSWRARMHVRSTGWRPGRRRLGRAQS